MDQKLIEYIKASREANVKEYFVRRTLLDMGWERGIIDDAMDSPQGWPSKGRVDFTNESSIKNALGLKGRISRIDHPVFIAIIIILILAIGGVTFWAIGEYNASYDYIRSSY